MLDTPAIASSVYGANTSVMALNAAGGLQRLGLLNQQAEDSSLYKAATQLIQNSQANQEVNVMAARRLVKVVIVDPNENIALDDCVLYSGDEKLTDATDQELFFEIDIKNLLEKHNEKRVKVIDKKVKERTEYLEPAKIRDLKMVVVNVASF